MAKDKVIEYRNITILVSNNTFYTLGKSYKNSEDAKSKIDRYWDYNENSDTVV